MTDQQTSFDSGQLQDTELSVRTRVEGWIGESGRRVQDTELIGFKDKAGRNEVVHKPSIIEQGDIGLTGGECSGHTVVGPLVSAALQDRGAWVGRWRGSAHEVAEVTTDVDVVAVDFDREDRVERSRDPIGLMGSASCGEADRGIALET